MSRFRPTLFSRSNGFTMIESLIVMVVLGVAAIAIVSLQGNIFFGQSSNKDIQIGVKLMQECAEQILATRRNGSSPTGGFSGPSSFGTSLTSGNPATNATGLCSVSPLPNGYSAPTVTITDGSSSTISACPLATDSSCKLVTITQGGLPSVSLVLVSY